MKTGARLSALLFRAICLGFSVLLLVLTLLGQLRLVSAQGRIEALESELCEAENTNTILNTKLAAGLSLEALERFAVQELGMQHPEPGQIVVLGPVG